MDPNQTVQDGSMLVAKALCWFCHGAAQIHNYHHICFVQRMLLEVISYCTSVIYKQYDVLQWVHKYAKWDTYKSTTFSKWASLIITCLSTLYLKQHLFLNHCVDIKTSKKCSFLYVFTEIIIVWTVLEWLKWFY
jgi:hypothetical protein